jgi:hypothetical protein
MADEKKEKKQGHKPSAEEIAAKKAAKAKAKGPQVDEGADEAPSTPAPPPRLIEHYRTKVVPELQKTLGITNIMATPRLEKIVISMGWAKPSPRARRASTSRRRRNCPSSPARSRFAARRRRASRTSRFAKARRRA